MKTWIGVAPTASGSYQTVSTMTATALGYQPYRIPDNDIGIEARLHFPDSLSQPKQFSRGTCDTSKGNVILQTILVCLGGLEYHMLRVEDRVVGHVH